MSLECSATSALQHALTNTRKVKPSSPKASLFRHFEHLLDPYPRDEPVRPPHGLLPFLWSCTEGLRGMIAAMALLTAAMSAFEALLSAMLGRIVDWLGGQAPERLWQDRGTTLIWLGIALAASIGVVALQ